MAMQIANSTKKTITIEMCRWCTVTNRYIYIKISVSGWKKFMEHYNKRKSEGWCDYGQIKVNGVVKRIPWWRR